MNYEIKIISTPSRPSRPRSGDTHKLMIADSADAPKGPVSPAALPHEVRVIEAAELFRGGKEIAILHEGSIYRMKITRQGKLILNK